MSNVRSVHVKNKILLLSVVSLVFFVRIGFSQQSDTLDLEDILKMSFDDLMNTEIISASKVNQPIREVAATVQVITAEQIKDRAYFTLEEALSDLPGVQFRNILGFNSYVFMRGAPSQNNLILLLVDGIQINELNSGGFYAGGQFNLADIEQIEVVYGPASALYGTNAVSGIINLITKKATAKSGGRVSIAGGNFTTGAIDFSIKNYNEKSDFGIYVSGMSKTTEKADLRGSKGDNNWTDNMENFENDLSFNVVANYRKLEAGVLFQEKKSSMSTQYKSVGEKYLDRNTLWDIYFLNSYLKYNYFTAKKWSLTSTLYYRNATVRPNTIDHVIKPTDSTPGDQVGYYRPNNLTGLETQLNINPVRRLRLSGGFIVEFENLADGFSISHSDSVNVKPPEPPGPDMLHNRLISFYLQAEVKIIEGLSFVGGVRHDFSNYYGNVAAPRTGLVLNLRKFSAKLLYNSAFRAPKPWDYNYGTGNNGLDPEKMQSYEMALSYHVAKNLNLGVSVYNNLIHAKLTKETDSMVDRWINKGNLQTVGFELYGTFSYKRMLIQGNYSYTDSYDTSDVFSPEIARHMGNLGITRAFGSSWKLNVRANFMGDRKNPFIIPSTGDNIIEDALLFHASVTYVLKNRFEFQLKVNNILNEEYYHPSNRFAGRYRQPQRSFLVRVTYNI